MFERARVTLTAWYLIIIMAISLAFSVVIYKSITFELRRAKERQEKRVILRTFDQPPLFLFEDDIFTEISFRLRNTLMLINLAILVGAGGLGYYLAGKTLSPIQDMLDQQARFVSDASHELKTPLTAMRISLEVQLREKTIANNQARTILSDNLEEVIRLQKLTEGLLELSKPQLKKVLLPTKLSEIIGAAVKDVEPLAVSKSIKVEVANSKKSVTVLADSMSLQRAIVAIIENAIKYSDPESIVKIRTTIADKNVEVTVRDHGIGISSKDLPFITERFYRGDKSRSSVGYGLGLSIAHKTVKEHNGILTITPAQHGIGTNVVITLPYSAKLQK